CSVFLAVSGGWSPHSASISRSAETAWFASSSRIASSARCFGPPSWSSWPSRPTVSGPRRPKSALSAPTLHVLSTISAFLQRREGSWRREFGTKHRRESTGRAEVPSGRLRPNRRVEGRTPAQGPSEGRSHEGRKQLELIGGGAA